LESTCDIQLEVFVTAELSPYGIWHDDNFKFALLLTRIKTSESVKTIFGVGVLVLTIR